MSPFQFIFQFTFFVMPQLRSSCGHKKAKWDNHSSCLSCCNCTVDNKCNICISWSEDIWYSPIRRRSYSSRMPRRQDESQPKEVSKKAAANDTSSHHGSGAEEVPSDQTDCVLQNVCSDKHHSGRVDDVVSNTRSENLQKGVISNDSGLENVSPPGNHPPDDSSSGQRELPGDTSLDNRARDQDDVYMSSMAEDTGSGNHASQRADNRSLPVRSDSRESELLGTGYPVRLCSNPGSRHTPGGIHPFLVPGMVVIAIVTKEVDLKLLLFLIRTNLVQLDIILDQVLLGHVPGRGQENILERRSLIVIGLILETLIDGDTKDIVLDLVHVVTRDLDVIIIPEVGSDHVTSVAVLVDLPLSKKRGVKFLALLLLIEI